MNTNKYNIFWLATFVIGVFLIFCNLQFFSIVENYYQQKDFNFLNQLTHTTQNKSLGYYIGQIEELYVGPVTNVVTHLLFAGFCLLYLKNTSGKVFAGSIFIFLIITKFNVLFYPPYGDAVGGPFAEAWWLAKNNFNYMELFHQPTYQAGGPKVYFFSIYPTYLAVFIKLIPNTKLFLVINHLIVYLASAVVVSLTRNIFKDSLGKINALLGSLVLLALPIFQSQTEAINMELPHLFFSVIAIYFLIQRRIGLASIFAVISVLVKGHGIITCGTVFVVSILLFLLDESETRNQKKKKVYFILCFWSYGSGFFEIRQ